MKRRGKAQSESSSASADEDTDADAAAENDAAGAAQHDAAGPSNICNRACTRETDRQRRTCALASLRSSAAQPQTHPQCMPGVVSSRRRFVQHDIHIHVHMYI
jgi:hypothetical protein